MDRNAILLSLPASLMSKLPKGILLLATDGTVEVYGQRSNQWQQRQFELGPLPYQSELSTRTWPGEATMMNNLKRAMVTDLPIEQFNGHVVTLFFFYVPSPGATNSYTAEIFAAYSWTTYEWMTVKNPAVVTAMLKPSLSVMQEAGVKMKNTGIALLCILLVIAFALVVGPQGLFIGGIAVAGFFIARFNKAQREAPDKVEVIQEIRDYLMSIETRINKQSVGGRV